MTASSRRSFLVSGAAAATTPLILRPESSQAIVDPALMPPPPPGGALRPGGVAAYNPVILSDDDNNWVPSPTTGFDTNLARSRILAQELSPLQQLTLASELYYAPFLFGAWSVKATLKRKVYPYGTTFLPSNSLLNGSPRNREEKVGDTCNYEVHYFYPNGEKNKNKGVIQDRAYNAVSISKAYKQFTPVQEVIWDYRKDPTKVVLQFSPGLLTDDMRPLGNRRTEIYMTARASENGSSSSNAFDKQQLQSYATCERNRAVTLAPGNVIVSDTETTTEFQKVDNDHVIAISRIAVYLTPNPNSREGILWQQVGGKAVAFFDYELEMTRIQEETTMEDGTSVKRACVTTSKNEIQCETS